MRIIIVQGGDFGEAYHRLQRGGPETYRDQRHTVNYVSDLAPRHDVTTIAFCDRQHDEQLAPGLRSIGLRRETATKGGAISSLLDSLQPELMVCRIPARAVLSWAASAQLPTFPVFADYFPNKTLRDRLNNWRLGRLLAACQAPCVANHSLSASQSLSRLGVAAERIVPWELTRIKPMAEAKRAPQRDRPFRLFYAGMLTESKGIGDCIEAVAIANASDKKVELRIAGPGDANKWSAYAQARDVGAFVRVLGVIPTEDVLTEMRKNDAVVVPSRHDFAEGLPNTIFEALASRSPLITSDHPAFVDRLRPAVDSLRFHAGHPRNLAEQVERLIGDPELYSRLSLESARALSRLYVGAEWSDLVTWFIEDPHCRGDWIRGRTLADLPSLVDWRSTPQPLPSVAI
jgi:glycosyltransferase involved in cell wall biosynthesis